MTTTIEEHRTHFRMGTNSYTIEITSQPDGGGGQRVTVRLKGAADDGTAVADGVVEVATAELETVIGLLAEELRSVAGLPTRGRRSLRPPPANQGLPWTEEMDVELERLWLSGDDVNAIAEHFERTPSAIRRRLPLVGCDPYTPGAYLPPPPSQRD